MSTQIELFQEEINRELANPQVVTALIETTFKGLSELNIRKAMLEGMSRGFKFKDFLQKDIYAIKFGEGYTLVTSIGHARKIAQASGQCGKTDPIYNETESGEIISCIITVKRKIDDYIGDYTSKVFFKEFYKAGSTYNGKYTPSMWDKMPHVMIAKVAEMHALRSAFPEKLSNMYEEDELSETIDITPKHESPSVLPTEDQSKAIEEKLKTIINEADMITYFNTLDPIFSRRPEIVDLFKARKVEITAIEPDVTV